jgi:hypothetical protein
MNDNSIEKNRVNYSYQKFIEEVNQIIIALDEYYKNFDENFMKLGMKRKILKFPIIKVKNCKITGIKYLEFDLNYSYSMNTDFHIDKENCISKLYENYLISENNESINPSLLFDFKVIYSEIYSSPLMYFNIFNDKGEPISFSNFLILKESQKFSQKIDLNDNKEILDNDNFEVEKSNFPMNGLVYYSLHLCNFSKFLNILYSFNSDSNSSCKENFESYNIILLWLSTIFNYFQIMIDESFYKYIK